ncbi:MAG: arylsulfatase [Puniceicoccaceae bacterium]
MKSTITLLLGVFVYCSAFAGKQPNVILMMTDDQGYGDVAAHGNPEIQTPNLDTLHSQSIRLTDFHVDPTCAPTRGATMTGKYSHRVRVWHTVRGGNHLRASEVTMADVFSNSGYRTAMFGKWHLGANYPYRPMDRGFQEWLGLGDGGTNTSDCYFWNDRVNDTYWHNGVREFREGFNPDVFYQAAMDYIRKRETDDPFFIYLPTYVPHKPYTFPAPDFHKKYLEMGIDAERAAFYASIEHVDMLIGQLRKVLETEGLDDNTIVIFMTDNGSTHGRHSFNAGMSGGKGATTDGGHRVPCFISWPGGKLGKPRDVPQLSAHIDLLPTLVELCDLQLPEPIDFDGKSLTPLLRGDKSAWPDRTIIVERQRSEERNPKGSAIMTQRWRLVGHGKLHDIQKDPGQENDVSKEHPEVVKRLMADFDKYWKRVTPDDRSHPAPIVGTPHDEETFLSFSELRDGSGYAHGYAAEGSVVEGTWHIEVAAQGVYEFEVRRWPHEASAPFRGVPQVNKTVDAWSSSRPKTTYLTRGSIKALPVHSVSLKVGEFEGSRKPGNNEEALIFDVELAKGKTTVEAAFHDDKGRWMTDAYYVYIRKKH